MRMFKTMLLLACILLTLSTVYQREASTTRAIDYGLQESVQLRTEIEAKTDTEDLSQLRQRIEQLEQELEETAAQLRLLEEEVSRRYVLRVRIERVLMHDLLGDTYIVREDGFDLHVSRNVYENCGIGDVISSENNPSEESAWRLFTTRLVVEDKFIDETV